jgi:hypothetical protein
MVAPKDFLLAVAAGIIGVPTLTSAQCHFDDSDSDSSLRNFDFVYHSLDLSARSFYLPPSIRSSHINEKVELALRD